MKARAGKKMWLAALMLMVMCVLGMGMTAQAQPGNTKITKAKAGDRKVTLKWKKASGADGYYIYYEKSNGDLKKIATVRGGGKTSATVTKLKNNVTYIFHIAAYAGSQTGEPSAGKQAMPTIGSPGKLKDVSVVRTSHKRVYLRWALNEKASGYQVFILNQQTGAYELIKNVSKTKNACMIGNLKNGQTYYFRVRGFLKKKGQIGYGPMSKVLVGRPVSYSTLRQTAQVHPYWYNAKMKRAVTVDGVTIPSGASITVTDLGSSKSKIIYKKNDSLKIPTDSFEVKADNAFIVKPSAAYSPEVAENFVNTKGYESATSYLLWISTYTQHLYVFQGKQYEWKFVKSTPCCTGKFEKPTPLGVSQVVTGSKKPVVFFTMVGDTAVQGGFWGMRVAGGYIHSWLYNITNIVRLDWSEDPPKIKEITVPVSSLPTTLSQGTSMQWNKENFSYPSSSGCVRVTISFAKWLYDTIPGSTTNVTY